MKLSNEDYADLAAEGPIGLDSRQQARIMSAVESIKERAFNDGYQAARARGQWLTDTRKEA